MPIIQVTLIEGYAESVKARLAQCLSQAARSIIPASPEATTVLVSEVTRAGYLRGSSPAKPAAAPPDPLEIVREFLAALEARELHAARALLAEGAVMTFPGNERFDTLEGLVAWARPRYRWVKKNLGHFDALPSETGTTVYVHGTLFGEWPDGTPFEGIRYIDRFEIAGGLIVRQDVWNDMGEVRA